MQIREARREDLHAVTEIYGRSVLAEAASFEVEPPTLEEMAARWCRVTSDGYPYLVADDGQGVILGFSYASTYRPRPAYRATVENSVYVHEAYRRRGVARTLLTALIEDCRTRGFMQMIAVIGDPENSGSVALHAALGFREIGTIESVGWKFERWVNSTYMQRAL